MALMLTETHPTVCVAELVFNHVEDFRFDVDLSICNRAFTALRGYLAFFILSHQTGLWCQDGRHAPHT